MIFHPAILALLVGSLLVSLMLITSCTYGVEILARWDLRSGSEKQLALERRTYLISTLMAYAFGFQLLSLFLFIYTADTLAPLFVGAMCAAGSLNVNGWGYPTIILKLINFVLAGLWLILNATDNRGYDYPLIRMKYAFLLSITPFVLAEAFTQTGYFLGLKPDIITSCCGTLFTSDAEGVTSGIVALPHTLVEAVFYTSLAATMGLGLFFYARGKAAWLFAMVNIITLVASMAALISFISLYYYEMPTHHCPFCLLQKEYGFVGYPLYLTFLGGAVAGLGVGLIGPFKKVKSLLSVIPLVQRNLTAISLAAYSLGLAITLYGVVFSNLSLRGY